jgi:hypothetical protein
VPKRRRVRPVSGRLEDVQKLCTTIRKPISRTTVLIPRVREWRRHWLVRIRRAVPGGWPTTEVREHRADTPAELRAVVDAARADPRVLGFPYESRRALEGTAPTRCNRGHEYGSSWRDARTDWLECICGGHMVYVCKHPVDDAECGDRLIDPELSWDCTASRPPFTAS